MKSLRPLALVMIIGFVAIATFTFYHAVSAVAPQYGNQPVLPLSTLPAPLSVVPPPREVVVALADEPNSLYVYAAANSPYNSTSISDAYNATRALMDGPITALNYDFQPVILTKIPRMEDGDVALQSTTVVSGTPIWDSNNGQVITYTGASTTMQQVVITFTLRSGIHWSNGLSLTAQDAVFGQQIACHPDTPTDKTVNCNLIVSYQSPAPLLVQEIGIPNYILRPPQYPAYWFYDPLPYQVLSATTPLQLVTGTYGRNPLGWGPFKVAEWIAGDHITLERNSFYWQTGYPRLDHVIFRWYNNAGALRNAIVRGEVQVVSTNAAYRFFSASELQTLAAVVGDDFLWDVSASWEHLDLNVSPVNGRYPFLADKQVRQAIAYALDRQQMIESAYGGWAHVANAVVPAENPAYPSTLHMYPYSPTLAMSLLTAAGWVDTNGDGIREKLGQSFVITYSTTNRSDRRVVGGIVQRNLAAVGISVTLDFIPGFGLFAGGGPLQQRTFDMAEFTWSDGSRGFNEPPCDLYLSTSIPNSFNDWSGVNYPGYSNPAYDAACLNAQQAVTRAISLAIYQQTVMSLSEDLPVIPLFNYLQHRMLVSRSINPTPGLNPSQYYELWNISAWDIASQAVVTPSETVIVTGSGGAVTTLFAPNTFSETVVITEVPQLPTQVNGEFNDTGLFFSLMAVSQATGQLIQPQQPYTVTLSYTDAAVQTSATNESTLGLYWWDGSQWVREPTSVVDTVANTVTATPNHLSLFAVLGETHRTYIPLVSR